MDFRKKGYDEAVSKAKEWYKVGKRLGWSDERTKKRTLELIGKRKDSMVSNAVMMASLDDGSHINGQAFANLDSKVSGFEDAIRDIRSGKIILR